MTAATSTSTSSRLADARPRPLWWEGLDGEPARPPWDPSAADADPYDVAIVGAGFSGLWTAFHLSELDPSLRIVVLERQCVGFGASGRNGGWAVGELAGSHAKYAARSSADEALRLERAIHGTVDQIGRVVDEHGIDCGFAKGGNIRVARTTPMLDRQHDEVEHARSIGHGADVIRLLDADEASVQLRATEVRGGIFFEPCAALDPARLAVGLAGVVESKGVTIHEGTTVESIEPGRVRTSAGDLTARSVVRATEAYTRDLRGHRRDLLPVYSFMVATEPIPADRWSEIGLADRPTFADDRNMVIYGQRTADDRIAFGATGLPYRFGSAIDRETEFGMASHEHVYRALVGILPQVEDLAITHRWGGVLGIPRNWTPSVHWDDTTRSGWLGGYVGEGVAASQLAGQTLAELIIGRSTDRTTLPWVGASSRRWEPEPLRWLGVRGSRLVFGAADRREERTDRDARLSNWLAGLLRGD